MPAITLDVEGETIEGDFHESPGAVRGAVIMVHGLLSSRKEFGEFPARLARRGFDVLALDARGHGASTGPRGVNSRGRCVADVKAASLWLRAKRDVKSVGILGHSLGASFALASVREVPDLSAAVLIAPPDTIRAEVGFLEFQGYRLGWWIHRLRLAFGFSGFEVPYRAKVADLFVDPEAVKEAESFAFLHPRVPLAIYPHLLAVHAAEWAAGVAKPVLVVVNRHDVLVDRKNSRRVFEALSGEKRLVELDSGHSPFLDRDRDRLLDEVEAWFGKHLAPGPF
ncbi:MAG: alpha/beta hydrolase [Methanobacteriota archaeon]